MPLLSALRFDALDRHRDLAPIFVRAFLATFLIYMSQDNVFSYDRMLEFRGFLAARRVPYPLLAAHVSVYAQFAAGLLYALGLFTRPAAAIMVVNFIVALIVAHVGTPFRTWLEPMAMLSGSLFLLVNGPGRLALDNLLAARLSAPRQLRSRTA
jgi:putative oxidoreductase